MGGGAETRDRALGQLIAGKYRVDSVIGRGGMAAVYRGLHVELDQPVAIKMLLPEFAAQERIVKRFVREARTIAKIQNKHVARVFDIGRLDSGVPFTVLELLEGKDLGRRLESEADLGVATAVDYVIQAADGLARAHAVGIVHRDVKPANLFLATEPDGQVTVKVIDFGIAKQVAGDGAAVTATSEVFGSPLYMAPEQVRASIDVDERTDVWALGVVLFELLTKHTPFEGGSVYELAAAILHGAPSSVRAYRSEVPEALERVILRCLEKSPEKRFPSAKALADALAPFASSAGRAVAGEVVGSTKIRPLYASEGDEHEVTARADVKAMLASGAATELQMETSSLVSPQKTAALSDSALFATSLAPSRRGWLVAAVIGGLVVIGVTASRMLPGASASSSTKQGIAAAADPLPAAPAKPSAPVVAPVETATPVVSASAPASAVAKPATPPPAVRPKPLVPTARASVPATATPTVEPTTEIPIIPRKGGD